METNEILINWIDDISFLYLSELKVSNDGEHEINQN